MSNISVKKKDIIYSFFLTLICGMFSQFQLVYMSVDNYYASLVTNRVFDTDNYCMFLNPVLCWIVGAMQSIFPGADWLTVLSRIVILFGIWCMGWMTARFTRSRKEMLIGYVILFMLSINASLFFDYFTIWAAFFMFSGMVLLIMSIRKEWECGMVVSGTVLVSCAVMWRIESAAIFIPFLLLELITEVFFYSKTSKDRIRMCRKIGMAIGPVFLCTVLLIGIDYGYKNSEKYADRVTFNNMAGDTVDFPMKEYEEVKEFLPDVSKNDYKSLQGRLYADTDRITLEYCTEIRNIGHENANEFSFWGIWNSNKALIQMVLKSKKTMFYGVVLLIFLIWIVLSSAKWYHKLELFLAYGGAYLVLIFFAFIGRIPFRIINATLYAVFGMVFILFFSEEWGNSKYELKWLKRILSVMILCIACIDTITYDYIGHQSLFAVRENADEDRWSSTYAEDDIYLWRTDEFVQHPLFDFMHQGKFLTEDFLNHNLCYGEWTYGQVYYENYLKKLGIPNPMKALLERENMYYVSENTRVVLTYLREHFDAEVQVKQVNEIDGIPVWKFWKE